MIDSNVRSKLEQLKIVVDKDFDYFVERLSQILPDEERHDYKKLYGAAFSMRAIVAHTVNSILRNEP